jgi:hypothetical protein
MWFATWGGGAWRYDGAAWTTYTPATTDDGLPSYNVDCILRDRAGALWFGTIHGLARLDGTSWAVYYAGDGQPAYSIESLYEDHRGNIWVGTGEGVLRFDGSLWGGYGKNDGLVSHEILSIAEGADGDLWFGTELGVTRHTPDRVPPRPIFVSLLPAVSSSPVRDLMYTAAYEDALGVQFSYSFDGSPWSEWTRANYWLASNLSDGEHTFRLNARDKIGNVSSKPAVCVFEIDAAAPSPVLAAPAFGQAVKDSVVLVGTAADPRFRKYVIEVRPNGAASWETLVQSESPVVEGVLCGWNTSSLPDGGYELRLSVTDTLGLTGNYPVKVIVDNHAPWADQTAPAMVSVLSGGDIYTTNEEVHLYFPPRAFDQDIEVDIVALADSEVPDTLGNETTRVLAGYEVSWGTAVLAKPAALEISYSGSLGCQLLTPPVPRTLAVYFSCGDNTWLRVGGTLDGPLECISCAVSEPGRYAVYTEGDGISGPSTLSDLSVTPRVFSAQGGFAASEVAISFTLGRPGPVTVKVYNRAGRLVREVASGQHMNAGANLVRWDGRDFQANLVQAGVYLVVVEALGQKETNTLAVVR